MRGKKVRRPGLGVVDDIRRKPVTCAPPTQSIRQVFEPLEPRVLLSASTVGDELIQPISASAAEVLANVAGDEVIYQEQTQYDNLFKPNVIAFDFAVDADAVNGMIDIQALSDLDHPSESVAYNIEGIVTGELWTGADDGIRPFIATIHLDDADLAAIAADGNLHIEFTPNSNVDDFQNVDEYVTVGLTYENTYQTIFLDYNSTSPAGTYSGSSTGELQTASDTDEYRLDLEAGQALTLRALPGTGLNLTLDLLDPTGTVIFSDTGLSQSAPALGQGIILPADGAYTIRIGTDGATQGSYALAVYVNEAIEDEYIGGPYNDDIGGAQSLNHLFRDLDSGLKQASIRGSISTSTNSGNPDVTITESFEGGVLPADWTTDIPYGGRVRVTNEYGASDGSNALILDSYTPGDNERLNKEAIWTVDLTGNQYWTLSFDYAEWGDYEHPLPESFTGSHIGDGVSMSVDGINWYRIFNPPNKSSGVWSNTTIDLSAIAAASGITLGPGVQIKFQQYDLFSSNTYRRGFDNIILSAKNNPPTQESRPDFYKFTLDAEEYASIRLSDTLADSSVAFKVYDPNHSLLYSSNRSSTATLSDLKAPITGEYVMEVISGSGEYNLSVLKGGGYGNPKVTSERFGRTGVSSSSLPSSYGNKYSFPVRAGDVLTFQTSTPDDGVSGLNTLNPYMRLYRFSSLTVTDYNSAPDGRNAQITHTALYDGVYYVEVLPTSGEGNYILTGSGYTGTDNADHLTIDLININNGYTFKHTPEYLTLELNNAPMLANLQAANVLINGVPATSFGLQASDNNILLCYLPTEAFNIGSNTFSIAAGAFRDIHGNTNEALSAELIFDDIPPTIIASSILQNEILAPGDVTIELTLSEAITLSSVIPPGEYAKIRNDSLLRPADAVSFDDTTNVLSLTYAGLGEGAYRVSVQSFLGYDKTGNGIDGEADPVNTVPTGDGVEGGDFDLNFIIEDNSTTPLDFSANPSAPAHSFSASSTFTDQFDYLGDEDRFTFDLKAGQTASIGLQTINDYRGDYDLDITFELFDPSGNMIATGMGRYPVIESAVVTEAGTYTLLIRTEDTSTLPFSYGIDYTGVVLLNAVIEDEPHDGRANDTLSSAKDINSAFTSLGDGVKQTVIVGDLTPVLRESFDQWPLRSDWTLESYGPFASAGYIVASASPSMPYTDLALLMTKNSSDPGYVLNEAVWTVDLSGVTDATLSFSQYSYNDESHPLPLTFTGHYDGDGVAISDDGINWYTLLTNPNLTSRQWYNYNYNLSQAAADAGMTLGPNFKIKLQQYDDQGFSSDGRVYDNLVITGSPVTAMPSDIYRVTLDPGEELSAALYPETAADSTFLQLLSPTGEVISVGSGGWLDASGAIRGFTATTGGDYYIRVIGVEGPYTLTVTRNAGFAPEPTDTGDVIPLGPSGKAIGYYEDDSSAPAYTDNYSFYANVGDNLTLWTTTPDIGLFPLANGLDSYLELYDPDGLMVAQADVGGDGLNVLINFDAEGAGQYTVKLRHADAPPGGTYTQGPYLLHVTGNSVTTPSLQVKSTSLDTDGHINTLFDEVTINFSDSVDIRTINASDLMFNGIPADSFTVVDSSSVTFGFSTGLAQGINAFTLAEGSVLGLNGSAVTAFAQQVTFDTVAPRIISSSIQQGEVLEPGQHILTLGFDEPIDESGLSTSSVYINGGPGQAGYRNVDWYTYNPATYELALGFNATYEGRYTATISTSIKDLAGNLLDGEMPQGTLPPEVSGDGLPGGQFVLTFDVDQSDVETVSDFKPAAPIRTLGSSTGPIEGYINNADDTDPYRLDLQAGQIVTVVLDPNSQDSPLLTLDAMGEQLVAGGPGEAIVWTYRCAGSDSVVDLVISADMATQFELAVYLNAVREPDLPAASSSAEPVYDLAGAWVDVPDQPASVATVYGQWQSSVIRQTINGNILAPGPYTFEFPDMFMPTGDGTLTITARADLDLSSEYLTIGGEGFSFGNVFASASNAFSRTATLTIPMADLIAMAADGTITFDVTPSPGVNEIRSSGYLTLSIAYPGMRDPAQDAYALELAAGQLISAMLYSTDDAYTMELVNTQTGAVVAVGEPGDISNIQAIGYTAAQAGRYDIRVHTASGSDYTLAVIRDAVLDVQLNSISETNAPVQSLDNTDRVLGYVQSPRPDRLFALGRPSPSSIGQTVYELDPLTFETIHKFSLENGIYAYDLAYDGINLYARSQQNGPVWTFDPESGALLHKIDYVNISLFSDLASYGGLLVQQTGSIANQLTFYDSFDAGVIRQLDLADVPQVQLDGLVGTEPRGSLFVSYREYVPETGYLTWVAEVDAVSGQTLNSFTIGQANVTSLAFVADQLYAFSSHSGQLGIYDPSTGQPFTPPQSIGLYVAIAGDGVVPRLTPDRYTLDLQPGQRVTLSTTTPFDTPGKAGTNMLDPALRVLDPNGDEVAADSNGTADGKNAQLTFTATTAGAYTVQVLAEAGYGEYVLNVERTPFLPGDLNGDGFVGIEDLNTVLGNWNQNVTVGNLMQGDASGDGFVGIEDLNAVLGNWNATLDPPTVEGDLDNDGFVGITDLNIVLGNWNQPVSPGDLTQGDPSNDGFVGIEDLNTVLGNWNAGTPPAVEALATSTREAVEAANASSSIESMTHTSNRRSLRTWPSDETASKRQHDTPSPAVAAAWSYLNRRIERAHNTGYIPWSLQQQEESPLVGLWEERMYNAESVTPA